MAPDAQPLLRPRVLGSDFLDFRPSTSSSVYLIVLNWALPATTARLWEHGRDAGGRLRGRWDGDGVVGWERWAWYGVGLMWQSCRQVAPTKPCTDTA